MRIFSIVLTAGIFLAILFHPMVYAEISVGQNAPDFSLPDINGVSRSLSETKGKYVVLEWTNRDCPFVQKHYKSGNMQALQGEFVEKGVTWFSIGSSALGKQGNLSSEEWKTFVHDSGAKASAVLLDPGGDVGRLYGAKTTPHMFIINPQGNVIYQGAIDDTPSADPADIPGSNNYVRSALNQAMAGKSVVDPSTKAYGCSVKY